MKQNMKCIGAVTVTEFIGTPLHCGGISKTNAVSHPDTPAASVNIGLNINIT